MPRPVPRFSFESLVDPTDLEMTSRRLSNSHLERTLLLVTVFLGMVHAWMGRYAMNPDGISYLDVGEFFFRRDWRHAINAYWSPLYPWVIGTVIGIANPSPKWEFPLVHLVNFVIFLIALLGFRLFLRSLLTFRREQFSQVTPESGDRLPEWSLVLLGYAVFWWAALELETLYDVTPDLMVMACLCFTMGLLLSLRSADRLRRFALFGLAAGIGYWTKAVLFPLGIVTLAASYWYRREDKNWRRGMIVAGLVFLFACTPLIFVISREKGRATFGDSGKLTYAWIVSPRTFWRNWQGAGATGIPLHATRQLLTYPAVFEFDGPVPGTYPPWTDPAYWNDGLRPGFNWSAQARVFAINLSAEARLLFRAQPALLVGVIVLALLSGRQWWTNLRGLWPLIFIAVVGMGVYLPILESDRYLGGFLLLFFIPLFAAAQFRPEDQRPATYLALAVFVVMAVGTLDYTGHILTHHLGVGMDGPTSTFQDVVAAEELRQMGAQPGDKVAVIADGTGAYWARLAKLRIVAEIMAADQGTGEFWAASEGQQEEVYRAFGRTRAKLVVSLCPLSPARIPDGWRPLVGTPYCVRTLQSDR